MEKTYIYVKKLEYNDRLRNIMIACEEKADQVDIVTIHPITDEKIVNRVMRGRWIKSE